MFRYIKNSNIEVAQVGEELGMLNLSSGMYYMLNSMGFEIWDLLDSGKSCDEIVVHLLDIYDVDKMTCDQQVKKLLSDMLLKGLIEEI